MYAHMDTHPYTCAYHRHNNNKEQKRKMDTEYKKQIRDAQAIYSLEFEKAEYTEEEKKDIDAFDRMMAEQKELKKRKQEAIETFMQLNGLK